MATETLRPATAGSSTDWTYQYPEADEHWDKVDEASADDDSTYIRAGYAEGYTFDLFNLSAHSIGSGVINKITVYIRQYSDKPVLGRPRLVIRTHDTNYTYLPPHRDTYTTDSVEYAENPHESAAWTWDEIDALQIGASNSYRYKGYYNFVTQVYVEVDYTTPLPVTDGDIIGVGIIRRS